MANKCPSCGLINPAEAERCDCGYDFVNQVQRRGPSGQGEACPHGGVKLGLIGRGIRLIIGGFAAAALGIMLYAQAARFDLAWYHPLPAFLLALVLLGWGLKLLLRAGQ